MDESRSVVGLRTASLQGRQAQTIHEAPDMRLARCASFFQEKEFLADCRMVFHSEKAAWSSSCKRCRDATWETLSPNTLKGHPRNKERHGAAIRLPRGQESCSSFSSPPSFLTYLRAQFLLGGCTGIGPLEPCVPLHDLTEVSTVGFLSTACWPSQVNNVG